MIDRNILEALQKATTAAVAASIMPTLPVAYIGITFTPPNDQKYLELVFLPGNTEDFWGSEDNYAGAYRLLLHWQNDKSGIYPAMEVIKSIAGYFTKDMQLPPVQIVSEPKLLSVIQDGSQLLLPASLRYAAFASS